jgi:hypothetical protein
LAVETYIYLQIQIAKDELESFIACVTGPKFVSATGGWRCKGPVLIFIEDDLIAP